VLTLEVEMIWMTMATVWAAEGPNNVISLDTMGFSGFVWRYVGDFGLLYERRLSGPHALVLQGGFTHAHGPPAHANVLSARLGYRLALAPAEERVVPYVGLLLGARQVSGEHEPYEDQPPTGTWTAWGPTGAVHVGTRVGLVGPVVLGTRIGVSGQTYMFSGCEGAGPGACEAATQLLAFSPVGVDTELSLGVAF
jgi:hypothetical protein